MHLLIYVPVALFQAGDGTLLLEQQACGGLHEWARNWDRVTVVLLRGEGPAPKGWVPLSQVGPGLERIRIETLPQAWRLGGYLRALPEARRLFRRLIDEADHCGFTLGGLIGARGEVGVAVAHGMGRPYYVWTDRVESRVVQAEIRTGSTWKRRLKARLTWRAMAAVERRAIRAADLGLFHGRETFEAYAPLSRNPHLVHDIMVETADHIPAKDLEAKQSEARASRLRIVYAGRADPMKGPQDWLGVLEALDRLGVDFEAEWLGEGSESDAMAARVAAAGLADRVRLRGFVSDRAEVLHALRRGQVLLFCHLTPESPRVLIEALISGTPIIGYDGAFSRDLIATAGGGVLRPIGDQAGLAAVLAELDRDRGRLAGLMGQAAADGAPFDRQSVFRHRSELIRAELPRR